MTDKPIGDINISPISTINQDNTNHSGLTRPLVPNNAPGIAITKYDNPAKPKPTANFVGAVGCFFQLFHNATNIGVKIIINSGFNSWKFAAWKYQLPKCRTVLFSANNAKTTAPDSSMPQKMIAAKNKGMYAITFLRSECDTLLDLNIIAK